MSARGMKQQIRSTQLWTLLRLSRWKSMKAVPTYQSYLLTHGHMHQFYFPSLSFLQEGAPDLLLNPRTPPMQQRAHPLTPDWLTISRSTTWRRPLSFTILKCNFLHNISWALLRSKYKKKAPCGSNIQGPRKLIICLNLYGDHPQAHHSEIITWWS